MMKRTFLIVAALALATLGLFAWISNRLDPPVETVVSSTLKAVQEQNRLSVFAARFVTAATSSKAKFGLSAQKTMILPAMIRYEVDLAKLQQKDVAWDAKAKLLTIKAPAIEVSNPDFDFAQTKEYESGVVLMSISDVEKLLDAENREKARLDLITQARAEPMMKLARAAAERAIGNSFIMPLKAVGNDANVKVEFAK